MTAPAQPGERGQRVSDADVARWAEKRADDAGRLARDLQDCRAELRLQQERAERAEAADARCVSQFENAQKAAGEMIQALNKSANGMHQRWRDAEDRFEKAEAEIAALCSALAVAKRDGWLAGRDAAAQEAADLWHHGVPVAEHEKYLRALEPPESLASDVGGPDPEGGQ